MKRIAATSLTRASAEISADLLPAFSHADLAFAWVVSDRDVWFVAEAQRVVAVLDQADDQIGGVAPHSRPRTSPAQVCVERISLVVIRLSRMWALQHVADRRYTAISEQPTRELGKCCAHRVMLRTRRLDTFNVAAGLHIQSSVAFQAPVWQGVPTSCNRSTATAFLCRPPNP